GVGVVWRPEQQRGAIENALEDALRGVELEPRLRLLDRAEIRMGEAVVPDLVSFAPDAADQRRVSLSVLADEEKRSRDVERLQLVEDLPRVGARRAVVDGQRDLFLAIAGARQDEGGRKLLIVLVEGQAGSPIDFQRAQAGLRQPLDVGDVALADELDVEGELDL